MKPSMLLYFALALLAGCADPSNDATGTFESTEIVVSAEASGRILTLDVQEGQVLQAGQIAGAIDSVSLYLRKIQLLASIRAVKTRRPDVSTQIAVLEQQLVTLQVERQRFEKLLKANAATRKQLEDINAQIALVEKQLLAQKSALTITVNSITEDVAAMEVQVAQIDDQLSRCRIVNPVKGTLLVKYAEVGELAVMGKPLYKIADTETMILRAYLTSAQMTRIQVGEGVTVVTEFGEEESREYPGTVEWISETAEFTPKTIQTRDERANLVYAVKISVKNDGYIKMGMYGEVKFSE